MVEPMKRLMCDDWLLEEYETVIIEIVGALPISRLPCISDEEIITITAGHFRCSRSL